MEDKEKIEKLLRNYRSLKSEIEIELNREYPEYSLDSVSFVKTRGENNSIVSKVEDFVVDKHSLSDGIRKKVQIVQIIKAAFNSLTNKRRKIVRHLYFENESCGEVGNKLGWSEITIKRKKKQILKKIKKVGILKAWDIWQKIDNKIK